MRNGALLGRLLSDVIKEQKTLAQALGEYEDEMTKYGFDVVRKSASMGARLMGQKPLPAESEGTTKFKGAK